MSAQQLYLAFLRTCTKLQLAKYHPEIIGITGSAGKSSAVFATYIVLKQKYSDKVQYTKKGNSETGIPFEVLQIPVQNYQGIGWLTPLFLSVWKLLTYWPSYSYFVIEMGIDSDQAPKNMTSLLELVHPQIGALLNVSSVHGANFSGSDVTQSIANEKRKLLTSLPTTGLAVLSADHPQILNGNPVIQAVQKTFSISAKKTADMTLEKYEVSLEGTTFTFNYLKKKYSLHFTNQLHTQAAFGSFAAALLIGEKCGVEIDDGITTLSSHFSLPPGRMTLFEGINHTTIIDSTYNSSPEATTSALEMMNDLKVSGRKITILGDMRELGAEEVTAHQELATEAAKVADILIWIGPISQKNSYDFLHKKGIKKPNYTFNTAWEALSAIKEIIKKDDLLLIKGSQNTILLEILVEALLANPERDTPLLPRRSAYWNQQRLALKKS